MQKIRFQWLLALLVVTSIIITSCSEKNPTSVKPGKSSTTTGQKFGAKRKNGEGETFETKKFKGQPAGPGLVFIEGGRHILGSFEEDVETTRNNVERTVTVHSFFMDEAEITNLNWLEYLHLLQLDSGQDIYDEALPDTTVWAQRLAYNDPYVKYYFRYPGFRVYPVVGVSWKQASDYSIWRTNIVNNDLAQKDGDKETKALAEANEPVPLESGVVLPGYRLPTEAEWEYAAKGLIGTQYLDENQDYARLYPWDGHSLRNPYGKEMGTMLANYKRGRGDYAGISGALNDAAMITCSVYANPPNDFGLYNMAGNVNEWVQDVFRPLTFEDLSFDDDLNPFRRDDYKDEVGQYDKVGNFETLIDNKSRIYKGGSWRDISYWLAPGTRRYIDEDSCTATIGFRCAMIKAGTNK